MLQLLCPMTIKLSPSMDKEGYCSLVPFTTPEAPLRYFTQMCFMVSSILTFFQMGALKFLPFQMWPDLIQKAKEGGLDVIQTYVFWNGHEPSPGKVRT